MDKNLLKIIRCPVCGKTFNFGKEWLVCRGCGKKYPAKRNVPILHIGKAADLKYPSAGKSQVNPLLKPIKFVYLKINNFLSGLSPIRPEFYRREVASQIPKGKKIKILDIGGGESIYRQQFVSPTDEYLILEVDFQAGFVQKSLTKNNYVIGDAHNKFTFAPQSFDVILLFEVLEHVKDPREIIRSCAYWLRPGGKLILSAPQYWKIHGWPSDYYRYTIYGLQELLNTSGLKTKKYWPMGGPYSLIWCMIKINSRFAQFFLIDWLIMTPLVLLARLADWINLKIYKQFLDTKGWLVSAQKQSD